MNTKAVIPMRPATRFALLCLLLALAAACYWPGLYGGFLFDDWVNIEANPYLRMSSFNLQALWQAGMSGAAGPLHRPLSLMSFALNQYFGGAAPFGFKAVNLAIHLVNGLGVFWLCRLLLWHYRRRAQPPLDEAAVYWISLATAALWLLHPLGLTSVLYVVQRMTSLSALFTLFGMVVYLTGRKRQLERRRGGGALLLLAVFGFTTLAALCKENGLLLPAYLLVAECTLLRWEAPDTAARRRLYALFSLVLLLPLAWALVFVAQHPGALTGGYAIREFSLGERLMTEARVLWFYVSLILWPDIAAMGFYHDDMVISRGLLSPPTTLPALLAWAVLLLGAWLGRDKQPLLAFGVLFFAVGHSMESTVLALELVHEHRNYLPMLGVLLPLAYYVLAPLRHPASLKLRRIAFALVLVLLALSTALRATHWRNPLHLLQMEVNHHPKSLRANADLAFQYASLPAADAAAAEENFHKALYYYTRSAYLSDHDTAGLFGILALNAERGLSTDPSWLNELEKRLLNSPTSPSQVNSLVALEKCQADGGCNHSPELTERLLRAALSNPTLRGAERGLVLMALSDFLFRVKQQPQAARQAAYEALAVAPADRTLRLTLIYFLIQQGALDAAAAEIKTMRAMDANGVYTPMLEKMQGLLAERAAAGKPASPE